jgi:hypothetical protein
MVRLMSDKPDKLMGGFLQKGGSDGKGIQIRVRADEMSHRPEDEPLGKPRKGRKTKLAAFGLSPSIIKAGDPEYAACLDQANKYRKIRMKELAGLHGHVSAGAGALLASASLALAASRFIYQRASAEGDTFLLKQASQLADSARQSELAAWEMSSREGVLKRRQEASEAGMPWLLNVAGEEKAKLGRKTNAQRQERLMDVPDRPVLDSYPEQDNA